MATSQFYVFCYFFGLMTAEILHAFTETDVVLDLWEKFTVSSSRAKADREE
jgi:hypothetical protein